MLLLKMSIHHNSFMNEYMFEFYELTIKRLIDNNITV